MTAHFLRLWRNFARRRLRVTRLTPIVLIILTGSSDRGGSLDSTLEKAPSHHQFVGNAEMLLAHSSCFVIDADDILMTLKITIV